MFYKLAFKNIFVLKILQSDNGKVIGVNDTSFQCDGSNSTFRVMFKEPVEILPNVSYTACSTLKVCIVLMLLLSVFCNFRCNFRHLLTR